MGIDARKRSTIVSLRKENGDLRRRVAVLSEAGDEGDMASRIEKLEAKVKLLKAMQSNSDKRAFGRRSEKRKRRRAGKRGQRPGAAGHSRTPRPGLERRGEVHEPDETACACCGKAYARHGSHESEIIEVEVKAHKQVIVRPRYHATCACPRAGSEVVAPPPTRLFANTPFGTSVWAMALLEKFRFHRPHRQVATWMTHHGLAMSAGTICGAPPRFEPLFAPLCTAILGHVNAARVQQGDETTWRIQEQGLDGGSQRAWLWIALSDDAVFFHVDPSRSAAAAEVLFGGVPEGTVLVCDRFSSYKALVKSLDLTLSFCWVHCRRDLLDCDGSQTTPWTEAWVDRINRLFEINTMRCQHHAPHRQEQNARLKAAQRRLEEACGAKIYSLIATLKRNRIDVALWLHQWLDACAADGGRPPHDLAPWPPWSMTPERRTELSGHPRQPP